eukprot:CCRYP_000803-RD/>CCRYP_000803-RD protein AED:0.48 eAED:0.48 QI:0/-1/0/1/-1/0/1/0/44
MRGRYYKRTCLFLNAPSKQKEDTTLMYNAYQLMLDLDRPFSQKC